MSDIVKKQTKNIRNQLMYHISTLQNKLGSEGALGTIKIDENTDNTQTLDGEDETNLIHAPPNLNNSKFSTSLD